MMNWYGFYIRFSPHWLLHLLFFLHKVDGKIRWWRRGPRVFSLDEATPWSIKLRDFGYSEVWPTHRIQDMCYIASDGEVCL